jgi:hypothetical protein
MNVSITLLCLLSCVLYLSEEFEEALKVGNLLGSLDLTVEGDVSKPLS